MRKNYAKGLIGLFVLLMALGGSHVIAGDGRSPGPTLVVSPAVAPLDKKTDIILMGSGFNEEQQIFIVLEDKLGVLTGLPIVAIPNERGCWAVVWTLGRYARKKLITQGVYSVMAVDTNYDLLASAPLALVDATKDPAKWPDWAKAARIRPKKKK